MPRLVFVGEQFGGRIYEFVVEKTTVGRGDHNMLVIRDPSVSHTHCEILVNGPEVIVRDLDSANGTFVNNVRLNKQSQAKSGQMVRFGLVEACLELDPPSFGDTATDITAVYELSRIQRDQRRAQKKPKPTDPSMRLEPSSAPDSTEHTTILAKPPQPNEHVKVSAPEQSEVPPPKTSKTRLIVILVVLALGLAALLWLMFGNQ